MPCALAGEWFILERRGVQVALEGAGADARVPATPGRLFLTTHRVVLVLDRASARGLVSLELPLGAVVGEPAFHQPVFTANNLSLLVAPAPGGGFAPAAAPRGAPPPSLPVRVFFTDGVGVLLPAFFGLLEATRRAAAAGDAAARARLAAPAAWVSSAFAGRDPSDPSILYLSQPVPPAPAVPLERQQPAVAGVAGPAPGAPTPPPGVSAGYYAAASAAGGAR